MSFTRYDLAAYANRGNPVQPIKFGNHGEANTFLLISSELFQMRYNLLQEGIDSEGKRSEIEKLRALILDLS
ncbi:MAG: hypothetical protein AAF702_42150 [Chloroflexota bacterium]